MKAIFLVPVIICIISNIATGQRTGNDSLLYLGLDPPGFMPGKFAPGQVSLLIKMSLVRYFQVMERNSLMRRMPDNLGLEVA